jgi:hypothetical protein
LANETRSLIAGEAAAPFIQDAVRDALRRAGRLGEVAGLRTLHLGPQTILVTICWRFKGRPSLQAVEADLAAIKACVRGADARISDVLFDFVGAAPASSADPGSSAADTAPPGPPARPRVRRG